MAESQIGKSNPNERMNINADTTNINTNNTPTQTNPTRTTQL